MSEVDFSKAQAKTVAVRGNISLIEIRVPQDLFHIAVLSGPDGYLLVDHPEAAAHPMVQKALDDLGRHPVKFLLNTHWHYDHVGGNEVYGPDATIVAQENVRKRLMTSQKPPWSKTAIGPYPERAWPRITFRDSLTIHFDGEDVEMDHYANGHTDGDSVVYFARANVVDRLDDETIVIAGHSELSHRSDLAKYVSLLGQTIAHVRQEVSAGKSEKEIVAEPLPDIWKPWFGIQASPVNHDFMREIYATVTHTSNLDQ